MAAPEGIEISHYENSKIKFPKGLSSVVDEKRLETNFSNYPEMQRELNAEQTRRLGIVRNTLLQLPLIHATHKDIPNGDIIPVSDLPEDHPSNTTGLDRSLGLDQYIFFYWGLPEKSSYGTNFLLTDANLLTSPNTIVTPFDIGAIRYASETPYDELSSEVKDAYQQRYFDKLVTGEQWLEIISRRVLAEIEKGSRFYSLSGRQAFGEVKYLGQIPSGAVQRIITPDDFKEYYKFLYEHGFAFTNMEEGRRLFLKYGEKYSVDPLPEECGINYEEASRYWEHALT